MATLSFLTCPGLLPDLRHGHFLSLKPFCFYCLPSSTVCIRHHSHVLREADLLSHVSEKIRSSLGPLEFTFPFLWLAWAGTWPTLGRRIPWVCPATWRRVFFRDMFSLEFFCFSSYQLKLLPHIALVCTIRMLTVLSPLSTYCVECFTYTFWLHNFDGWNFYRGLQLCVFQGDSMIAHQCLPNLHSYRRSPRKDCRVCHSSLETQINHPEVGAECDILRCFLEQHEFFSLVYRGYLRGYRRESLPQVLWRSVCPHVHESVGDNPLL